MKRIFIIGFAFLLVVGLTSIALVKAQDNKEVKKVTVQNQDRGRYFVDKDKNGICDNNKMSAGQGMGRMNNNRGRNFVDKNKDGQCDNFPQGRGSRMSDGVRPNFVDKNNDGICDNRPDGMRKGMGRKNGNCDGSRKGWRGGR